MKTNRIGRTDVKVSHVSFGCSGLGNLGCKISDAEAHAVLAYAWDNGIRYFDTAPHYGRGRSEQRLGDFLKGRRREDYVISTKVGRLLSPGIGQDEADGFLQPLPNDVRYDYSAAGIEAAFEQSCARLGVSEIDILYVHDIGEYCHGTAANEAHMEDLLSSGVAKLQDLKARGKIGAFGLGVNENEVCLEVMKHCDLDVILLAGRLTLLDRSAEEELVGRCRDAGTSLVLGGIFNSGILARGAVAGATYDYAPPSEDIVNKVRALEANTQEYGISLATAALQFALHHPGAASVLLGTTKVSSLTRNLDSIAAPFPDEAKALFV